MVPIMQRPHDPTPAERRDAPAPIESLPALTTSNPAAATYVEVSPNCSSGLTVAIVPAGKSALVAIVRGSNGGVVALGLRGFPGVKVRLWSYDGNRLVGALTFPISPTG